MDAFNFAFTLFGLLLGFTLVEVLSGLAKTLQFHGRIRAGWLTPLLAIFVMLDVLSFWDGAWAARALIPVSYGTLLAGLVITGVYYLAASWIFPQSWEDGTDLDAHYLDHRRIVLPGIWACNAIPFSLLAWQAAQPMSMSGISLIGLYWVLVGTAFISRSKVVNVVALGGLIAVYLVNAFLSWNGG
ncbi:hypothetical protein ASG37_05020 [Sphingomonas sp. Leaf407]|uniref:hypothetical protein n=1 Tax=unclassified Sphingomonas TaxID=196159 RepID=UPI0006FABB3D|nr:MULTISPECIES: hypothetical protein [unclassified Sphingomonas]KQN37024.1 hypothetical protein ASE97_10935 [Sphingomonas sp. Leaf42]KQT30451.1 hypothetical protein ASG37_05020 [Sphingomonas sp. Leaf407]